MKLASQIYEFGPFRLETSKRLLMRDLESAPLTPKCYEILAALVEASGEVLSKESLIERVWPDSFVEDGNLTYNISILRKALGERAGAHKYIVTVPGRGYQFVEKVRELTNEGADAVATPADFVSFETAVRSQEKARVAIEPARGKSDEVPEPFFSSITRNKRGVLLAAGMLVIAGAGIGFGLHRFMSIKQSHSRAAEPFEALR